MSAPENESPKPLPPGQTRYIDIAKIKIPPDARKHPDERIAAMAEDLKKNDLINEITVVPDGDGFELVSGQRRLLGAALAGWQQIRCSVREGLSKLDKLRLMFNENEDRDGATPFYQASLVEEMLAQTGGSQKEVAIVLGIDEANISRYRVIARIPDDLKEKLARANFSYAQVRELIPLENPDQFHAMAEKAIAQGLSSRAIAAQVANIQKHASAGKKAQKKGNRGKSRDPYADVWAAMANAGQWKVAYKGNNQWAFYVTAGSKENAKAELTQWFAQMTQGMGGAPSPSSPAATGAPATLRVEGLPSPSPQASSQGGGSIMLPPRAAVPVPVIKEADFIAGNKLRLTWEPLGPGFRYRLFRSWGTPENPSFEPVCKSEVTTPGAVINVYAGAVSSTLIAVMAIDPQGHESELSKPVHYKLKSWNNADTVEPLPS